MGDLRRENEVHIQPFVFSESKWDSEHFGVRSAKIILNDSISDEDREKIKQGFKAFDFITITNVDNRADNNVWIGKETGAFQTDINVQFKKSLSRTPARETLPTEVFEACPRNERILDIANKSFKYSRFLNDPWLPPKEAKGLYARWVEDAFGKPGRFFVIAKRHGVLMGFLLFSMDMSASSARIELIATDKVHRGESVGRSLITTMEIVLRQRGIATVHVGTQLDNLSAFGFYTSCGFKFFTCNSVYHYWPFK